MIRQGETFWLDIFIKNGIGVYAIPINLVYPTANLEVVKLANGKPDVAVGNFLGGNYSLVANFENDMPGKLVIGYSLIGNEPIKDGDGLLCSVKMKRLITDETALIFTANSKVLGRDSAGNLIPVSSKFQDFILEVAPDQEQNVVYIMVRNIL